MPKARKSSRPTTSPYGRKEDHTNNKVMELLAKMNDRLENLEKKTEAQNQAVGIGRDAEAVVDSDSEVSFRYDIPVARQEGPLPIEKEHAANVSGENFNSNYTSTFSSGGRQITSLVSENLRNKIWSHNFVEMKDLLKGSEERTTCAIEVENMSEAGTSFKIVNKAQNSGSKSLPITAWARAFNRFTAIMSLKHPEWSIGLNQHQETVLSIADQNGSWNYYDIEFRNLIAKGEATWGSTNLELYLFAMIKSDSKKSSGSGLYIPKGACHKFHTTGYCLYADKCNFQHKCPGCLSSHPRFRCPAPASKPMILPKFAKSFQQRAPFQAGASNKGGGNNKGNSAANAGKSN